MHATVKFNFFVLNAPKSIAAHGAEPHRVRDSMQRYPAAFRGEHYFAVVLADGMLKADRVTGPGAAGFGG
jgi:hypothetical protein